MNFFPVNMRRCIPILYQLNIKMEPAAQLSDESLVVTTKIPPLVSSAHMVSLCIFLLPSGINHLRTPQLYKATLWKGRGPQDGNPCSSAVSRVIKTSFSMTLQYNTFKAWLYRTREVAHCPLNLCTNPISETSVAQVPPSTPQKKRKIKKMSCMVCSFVIVPHANVCTCMHTLTCRELQGCFVLFNTHQMEKILHNFGSGLDCTDEWTTAGKEQRLWLSGLFFCWILVTWSRCSVSTPENTRDTLSPGVAPEQIVIASDLVIWIYYPSQWHQKECREKGPS